MPPWHDVLLSTNEWLCDGFNVHVWTVANRISTHMDVESRKLSSQVPTTAAFLRTLHLSCAYKLIKTSSAPTPVKERRKREHSVGNIGKDKIGSVVSHAQRCWTCGTKKKSELSRTSSTRITSHLVPYRFLLFTPKKSELKPTKLSVTSEMVSQMVQKNSGHFEVLIPVMKTARLLPANLSTLTKKLSCA